MSGQKCAAENPENRTMYSMMDEVYFFELRRANEFQDFFTDWHKIFIFISKWSDQNIILDFLFPLISVIDSKFAAELLLSISAQGWLISTLNMVIREDRPLWWLSEKNTTEKFDFTFSSQSCKTSYGPFCSNVAGVTTVISVIHGWLSSVLYNNNRYKRRQLDNIFLGLKIVIPLAVALAQIFNSNIFFHQGVLGYILSLILADFFNVWFMEPVVDYDIEYFNNMKKGELPDREYFHRCLVLKNVSNIMFVSAMFGMNFILFICLKMLDINPLNSVNLAIKHCPLKEYIDNATSPCYSIIRDISNMFALALSLHPSMKFNRYCTRNRSLAVAVVLALLLNQVFSDFQTSLTTISPGYFYTIMFANCVLKAVYFLRIGPLIALYVGQRDILGFLNTPINI